MTARLIIVVEPENARSAMNCALTLRDLGRIAVSRSLVPPAALGEAVSRMGFVQADPIRAPARAHDQTCAIASPSTAPAS